MNTLRIWCEMDGIHTNSPNNSQRFVGSRCGIYFSHDLTKLETSRHSQFRQILRAEKGTLLGRILRILGDVIVSPSNLLFQSSSMSDHLVNWFKDHLTSLYQSVSNSAEGELSSRVESLFEEDAHIIYNHEQIDLAKFSEGLDASSSAVVEAQVEWKKVMSLTAGRHSETQQVRNHFLQANHFYRRIELGCHC